jgi:hypothetical protein
LTAWARDAWPLGLLLGLGATNQGVVFRPFFGVRQNRIRLANALKVSFGSWVIRIGIGVVFSGKLTVRCLDGFGISKLFNFQKLVVIPFWIHAISSISKGS